MTPRKLVPVQAPAPYAHRKLWVTAAAVALCGHLALAAFAIARMQEEPEDADLGAPGVEIAYELASAPVAPSDLPPGPESEASAASPPVLEQTAKPKDTDLPKDTPVEAEQPDRLVTIEKSEKPPQEEPDVKARMAKPQEESTAQQATAPPTISKARRAIKSATLQQGTGESRQRQRANWQKELMAHLNKYKRYPADRSQQSANILIAMRLDRSGRVVGAKVARSSGDAVFDHAAVAMVERASPVPPPPPLVADEGLDFALPVNFRKNDR